MRWVKQMKKARQDTFVPALKHSSKHGDWKTDRLEMFFLSTPANIRLACCCGVEDDPTQQVAYL